MERSKSIECPNCGHSIDLESMLYEEVKSEIQEELSAAAYESAKRDFDSERIDYENKLKQRELKEKKMQKQVKNLEKELKHAKELTESDYQKGRAQELLIAEWLTKEFKYDEIQQVKTGRSGADCLQLVVSDGEIRGRIYYESKKTKAYQKAWLPKLIKDMKAVDADLGILVTSARPTGAEGVVQEGNIWICSFEEFKAISVVLREELIRLHSIRALEVGSSDRMERLYRYLTGDEFKSRFGAIIDNFISMSHELNSERRYMERKWKIREQKLRAVLDSAREIHSSFREIGGSSFERIRNLELGP